MERDDIIRWAREVGCEETRGMDAFRFTIEELEGFAVTVAAAERRACADVCEGHYATDMAARAIRARGET